MTSADPTSLFAKSLFFGLIPEDLAFPFPRLTDSDTADSLELFLESIRRFGTSQIDSREIDENAHIPYYLIQGLRRLGLFGMSLPEAYGGSGLDSRMFCRVMQEHCGQFKSEGALRAGLRLLRGMRESEVRQLTAANPHELARAAECLALLTAGEAVLQACLARRASSALLNFHRLDFPDEDPPERRNLLVLRRAGEEALVEEQPLDWHLRPPYDAGYEENYRRHCRAGEGA